MKKIEDDWYKLEIKNYPYNKSFAKDCVRVYNIDGNEAYFAGAHFRCMLLCSFRPSKRYETLEEVKADAKKLSSPMFMQLLEKFVKQYPYYFQDVDALCYFESCVWEDVFEPFTDIKDERESYIPLGDGKWEISLCFDFTLRYFGRVNTKKHPCEIDTSKYKGTTFFQAVGYSDVFCNKFVEYINSVGGDKLKVFGSEWSVGGDPNNERSKWFDSWWGYFEIRERFIVPLEEGDPGIGDGTGRLSDFSYLAETNRPIAYI